MEKKTNGKVSDSAPGVDSKQPPSVAEIKQWLVRDLSIAIMVLQSVYQDQGTTDMLAEYLYGRYMNSLHKEELDRQLKLQPEV